MTEHRLIAWIRKFNRVDRRNPANRRTRKPYLESAVPITAVNWIDEHGDRYNASGTDCLEEFVRDLLDKQERLAHSIKEDIATLDDVNALMEETLQRLTAAGLDDVISNATAKRREGA